MHCLDRGLLVEEQFFEMDCFDGNRHQLRISRSPGPSLAEPFPFDRWTPAAAGVRRAVSFGFSKRWPPGPLVQIVLHAHVLEYVGHRRGELLARPRIPSFPAIPNSRRASGGREPLNGLASGFAVGRERCGRHVCECLEIH